MAIKQSEHDTNRSIIILAGPAGAGKTFAAATGSKFFPHDRIEELQSLSEAKGAKAVAGRLVELPWISLSDMLWLPIDDGALDGLRAFKINVPYVDWRGLVMKNIERAKDADTEGLPIVPRIMALAAREIREALAAPDGKYDFVVVDTISNLDLAIVTYADAKFEGPAAYREILSMHRQLFGMLQGLDRNVIACSHLEALTDPIKMNGPAGEAQAADQKLRAEAVKMVGGGKLTLAMHRKARQAWQGGSTQFAVIAKKNDKGVLQRHLVTEVENSAGVEARVREEILVDTREPVRLRELLVRLGKIAA